MAADRIQGDPFPPHDELGGAQVVLPMGIRVAVVHDYLTQQGGAERVVLALMRAFPGARLITTLYNSATTYPQFAAYDIETSWLQKAAPLRRDPRRALPLLSRAVDSIELDEVDVVIASSSGWAHGVRTTGCKLVYCHNPARWIYQHSDYIAGQSLPVRAAFRLARPSLRRWDQAAAATADRYVVNSRTVQERVRGTYGITADIIPPPISIEVAAEKKPVLDLKPGFFLVVGRPRGYKNVDVTCEAFAEMPDQRLVVVGGLPDAADGRSWTSNMTGLVGVADAELRWLYDNCRAVVATAHEDFGLTPLEGNAFGRPALTLRAGGFLDTVVDGVTGHYIDRLDAASVIRAVRLALETDLDPSIILQHAERYSTRSFGNAMRRHVCELLAGPDGRGEVSTA